MDTNGISFFPRWIHNALKGHMLLMSAVLLAVLMILTNGSLRHTIYRAELVQN